MNRSSMKHLIVLAAPLLIAACSTGAAQERTAPEETSPRDGGPVAEVMDTLLSTNLLASGTAEPMRAATLSTKLMASVTAVLVQEGDMVAAGAVLVRLDARDLEAKAEQVAASEASAEAMRAQAAAHAARMRALFVQGAAPKATLEAAEASLSQAESALRGARAAGAELASVGSYAEVRAPFAGRVTQRFVDPGAFAAPGAPLVTIQDSRSLRITVHASPDAVRALRRGQHLAATIEGVTAQATIEGVVPVMGSLYQINAIVENAEGAYLPGSAATLLVPAGTHRALAIPADALRYEGDLVGVTVRTGTSDARRWIRVGMRTGDLVEVTSGLRAGEQVVRHASGGAD
ncbi:MAG: efflux RND transporter periplasmic adaptor subunit [Gemmatimonadota bacterium]|nr:efflux RND transporter periplasmic adaptor subunit [Gemmatimonadota bacterium]